MKKAKLKRSAALGGVQHQEPKLTPKTIWFNCLDYFGFEQPSLNKDWILGLVTTLLIFTLIGNFSYLITSNPVFIGTYKAIGMGAWFAIYAVVSWLIWSTKTHIPLHISLAASIGFTLTSLPLLSILFNAGGTWGIALFNGLVYVGLPVDSITLLYTALFILTSIYLGNPLFKITRWIKRFIHPVTAKQNILKAAKNRTFVTPKAEAIIPNEIIDQGQQSPVTKLFEAYGLQNAQSIKVIPGSVIHREIIKLPVGSNINTLEKNIKNIKRDFGKPLVINGFVKDHPSCIAVDVPSRNRKIVEYQKLYNSPEYQKSTASIPLLLGEDTQKNIIIEDLAEMPHLLIAGKSGGGKTSLAHSIICSLAMRFSPKDIQFQLIDLKRLDMTFYESLPHLAHKTTYTFDAAARAAEGIVMELERRKKIIAEAKCIDIIHYNQQHPDKKLPFLVFITDEIAVIFNAQKTEDPDNEKKLKTHRNIILPDMNIISQQSRAFGVHMVMMTQNPSKTAIPSDIQANIGQRICLTTSTEEESRFILNSPNAAYLLKKGDGFLYNDDTSEYERIHAPFLDAKNGDLEKTIKTIKQKWSNA